MTESVDQKNGSPLAFFTLTLSISWLLWLPGVLETFNILTLNLDASVYVALNVIGGAVPTIVGLLLFYKEGGTVKLKEVLLRGIDPRRIGRIWWLPLLFLIPIINACALVLGVVTGGEVPNMPLLQEWWLIPVLFIVGFIPISNAFREEFGWRGYAIERLQSRRNALVTSIIIGLAWGLWHLPLFYFPGAMEVYANKPFFVFLLNTTTLSVIMTWLYNNNRGSIFTGVAFHVVLNMTPSIFPFEQAGLGIYFNMILLFIAAVIIVLYYSPEKMMRESKQA